MNNSSVGACLITMNHEKFILESVDALLSQSLDLKEIIIVDDASQDYTFSELEKIARRNKKIRLIRNAKRQGPSESSNIALRSVKTDFILYTSGDDISKRNRAEVQLSYLIKNPDALCLVSNVEFLFEDRNHDPSKVPTFYNPQKTGPNLFELLFWKQNFLNASTAFFRRIPNISNLFDKRYLYLQDYDLWLRLSLQDKLIISDDVVLDYRISQHSLSQRSGVTESIENAQLNKELSSLLSENLNSLSLSDIQIIFGKFIHRYSKKLSQPCPRNLLIHFLLLSHNNPDIQDFALAQIEESIGFENFEIKIGDFFVTKPKLLVN
jgi:glycosyltransferase involved in cell wall biosynthesis